jgi:regulator of sigma E protease
MGYFIPKFISESLSRGDYKSIAAGSVSSPVGMYFVVDEIKKEGVLSLLNITALMSLSLAIINALPIPALDGGRVFLLLIEKIIGKSLNSKLEAKLIKYSFYALLIFMVLVLLKDIIFIDLIKNMVG